MLASTSGIIQGPSRPTATVTRNGEEIAKRVDGDGLFIAKEEKIVVPKRLVSRGRSALGSKMDNALLILKQLKPCHDNICAALAMMRCHVFAGSAGQTLCPRWRH